MYSINTEEEEETERKKKEKIKYNSTMAATVWTFMPANICLC